MGRPPTKRTLVRPEGAQLQQALGLFERRIIEHPRGHWEANSESCKLPGVGHAYPGQGGYTTVTMRQAAALLYKVPVLRERYVPVCGKAWCVCPDHLRPISQNVRVMRRGQQFLLVALAKKLKMPFDTLYEQWAAKKRLKKEALMPLNMNEYLTGTVERTRVHPTIPLDSQQWKEILAMGVVGEVGEVIDQLKKHVGHGHQLTEKLTTELGDVVWYVCALALYTLPADRIALLFEPVSKAPPVKLPMLARFGSKAASDVLGAVLLGYDAKLHLSDVGEFVGDCMQLVPGLTLRDVLEVNAQKLAKRYPINFDPALSQAREAK